MQAFECLKYFLLFSSGLLSLLFLMAALYCIAEHTFSDIVNYSLAGAAVTENLIFVSAASIFCAKQKRPREIVPIYASDDEDVHEECWDNFQLQFKRG